MLKTPRRLSALLFVVTLTLNLTILLFARYALRHSVSEALRKDAPVSNQAIKISDGLSVTQIASTPEEVRVFQGLNGAIFRYQIHETAPNQMLNLIVDVWKKGKRAGDIGGLGTAPAPLGDSLVTVSLMPLGKSFFEADKVKVVVGMSGESVSHIADNPLKNCVSYGATGATLTRGGGLSLLATARSAAPGAAPRTGPEDVAVFLRLQQAPFTGPEISASH